MVGTCVGNALPSIDTAGTFSAMPVVYNKLARDQIPDIIAATGSRPSTVVLDHVSYQGALRSKLLEESCLRQSVEDDLDQVPGSGIPFVLLETGQVADEEDDVPGVDRRGEWSLRPCRIEEHRDRFADRAQGCARPGPATRPPRRRAKTPRLMRA